MIFGLFDQLFPLMFTVIFLIVIGTFIYTAVTDLPHGIRTTNPRD